MKKVVFLFITFCMGLSAIARAGGECEDLILKERAPLEQAIDAEFYKIFGKKPGELSFYGKIKKRMLRNRIVRKCLASPVGCTQADIDGLVRQSIQSSLVSRNTRNLTLLSLGMAATSLVTTKLLMYFDPAIKFLPAFVGGIVAQTTILSAAILAPYASSITGKIQKSATKVSKKEGHLDLEEQYDLTTRTYTPREQYSIERTYLLQDIVWLTLKTASEYLEKGDTDSVVRTLAHLVSSSYKHYRDVRPDNPVILSAIEAVFVRDGIAGAEILYDKTLNFLMERDPDFRKAAGIVYARRALSVWLGLNAN